MARPKRTRTEREEALAKVAELDRRGYSQRQIARELGVSAPQVNYDLKQVRHRYAASMLDSRTALVNQKIEELRQVRQEAWDGWRRSCCDSVEVVDEKVLRNGRTRRRPTLFDPDPSPDDDELTTGRQVVTTTSQAGDPRFLEVILKTLADERALLSLDEPAKMEGRTTVIPWAMLVSESPAPERDVSEPVPAPSTNGDTASSRNGNGRRSTDVGGRRPYANTQ